MRIACYWNNVMMADPEIIDTADEVLGVRILVLDMETLAASAVHQINGS